MIGTIIGAIIAGLIIGALARLFMPGKQNISLVMTIIIGIIASVVTTLILGAIFNYSGGGGISWWYWIVSIVVAIIGISIYARATDKTA